MHHFQPSPSLCARNYCDNIICCKYGDISEVNTLLEQLDCWRNKICSSVLKCSSSFLLTAEDLKEIRATFHLDDKF